MPHAWRNNPCCPYVFDTLKCSFGSALTHRMSPIRNVWLDLIRPCLQLHHAVLTRVVSHYTSFPAPFRRCLIYHAPTRQASLRATRPPHHLQPAFSQSEGAADSRTGGVDARGKWVFQLFGAESNDAPSSHAPETPQQPVESNKGRPLSIRGTPQVKRRFFFWLNAPQRGGHHQKGSLCFSMATFNHDFSV